MNGMVSLTGEDGVFWTWGAGLGFGFDASFAATHTFEIYCW